MKPSIGRIVHYKITAQDAVQANKRRAALETTGPAAHIGNELRAGEVYPAMMVRVWGPGSLVQLQVFLDGNDTLWATSVPVASDHGSHTPDNLHPERSYVWPRHI